MTAREERPGKYSLQFGENKISLQDTANSPSIARDTVPGSGNFCLLSDTPVAEWRAHLAAEGAEIIDSGLSDGATGTIDSLSFRDLDGNLIEVSNRVVHRSVTPCSPTCDMLARARSWLDRQRMGEGERG